MRKKFLGNLINKGNSKNYLTKAPRISYFRRPILKSQHIDFDHETRSIQVQVTRGIDRSISR